MKFRHCPGRVYDDPVIGALPVPRQRRRDPLNPLRSISYATPWLSRWSGLSSMSRSHGSPGFAREDEARSEDEGRGQKTHDMIGDFLAVYDELNENIDMYVDRKEDIRKPLKVVIRRIPSFNRACGPIKDAAGVPAEEANNTNS